MPFFEQSVSADDVIESTCIECVLFDEARDTIMISRTPDLQGDCGQMFRCENARRNPVHVSHDCGPKRLFDERSEFNRPVLDDDKLALRLVTASEQVVVDGAEREQCSANRSRQSDEHVQIFSRERLQPKDRSDCAADGIPSDDTVGLIWLMSAKIFSIRRPDRIRASMAGGKFRVMWTHRRASARYRKSSSTCAPAIHSAPSSSRSASRYWCRKRCTATPMAFVLMPSSSTSAS